jgi:hypothetical protein
LTNVARRIAVQQHEICARARYDLAVLAESEDARRVRSRRLKRLNRSEADVLDE